MDRMTNWNIPFRAAEAGLGAVVMVGLLLGTNACALPVPSGFLPSTARYLIELIGDEAIARESPAVAGLPAEAGGTGSYGKTNKSFSVTFFLSPKAVDLNPRQRTELARRLRGIGSGTPFSVRISSGPGGAPGSTAAAVAALRRAKAAASHFASARGRLVLRYDPRLKTGELRIDIRPAKENTDA